MTIGSAAITAEADVLPRAADSIVDILVNLGLSVFFGVPGGPVIPIFDAILTHPRATLVESRQETAACFAAMGFYQSTGRIPVVVTTAGPGATGVVTGVTAASLEEVPLVIICGDVPWATTGMCLLQDTGEAGIAIERMLAPVVRKAVRVSRAESASGQALAVVAAATSPRPGPALLVVPVDHAGHRVSPVEVMHSPPEIRPARPSDDMIDRVVRAVKDSQRPLLVIGAGCRPFAPDIAKLVETLGIPVMTTPRGKGILSEEHPLSLRAGGMASSHWARRYTRLGVDCAIVLGTDLDDVSTAGTPPVASGGRLFHVDRRPEVFGRNFSTELGVATDIQDFCQSVTLRPHIEGYRSLLDDVKARSPFDVAEFRQEEAIPIAPHRVVADLENSAPPGTRFVTDIGEHMLFALHYLTATSPDGFTIHLGLGSMGSGIGSAIGMALGDSTRPVICICGDGGMQMIGSELLVAVRHRLPIVFAIFNDARYNMVYHGYRLTFGREAAYDTPVIDFVNWATSMGARARLIEKPGEITPAVFEAIHEGPVVLDIRQDAAMRIKGDGRLEAVRQMSLLHTTANLNPELEDGVTPPRPTLTRIS